MPQSELETLVENLLVDELSPILKQEIDELIAKGEPVMRVYGYLERTIRLNHTGPGESVVLLQVEAYLDRHYQTTFAEDRKADSLGYPRRRKTA